MGMLDCKSLMVGDWVMVYPWDETPWKPKKITDINFHSWEGTDFCDNIGVEGWDELSLDQIKPIPLTPEILEKNGFERSIDRGWGNDLREIYRLTYDVDVTYEGQTETFTHEIEVQHHVSNGPWDVETTNGSLIMNLEYVHQLQHAMRICGIEKEIVL